MRVPGRFENPAGTAHLPLPIQDDFDRARLSSQCCIAFCGCALTLAAGAAGTDQASAMKPGAVGAVAQVQSLDRFQAEQERLKKLMEGKPKAYEDKVMDPSELAEAPVANDTLAGEEGLGLRSYSVETRFGRSASSVSGLDTLSASEWGLRTEYRQETLNHGEWLLQADTRARNGNPFLGTGPLTYSNEKSSTRLTLYNLGFPVTSTIFADTFLGDIYSDVTEGLGRSYRLSLGSSAVRGLRTKIFSRDFDLRAGVGERGMLAGGPYPGFVRNQGTLAWAGYTRRLTNKWFAAAQVNQASQVRNYGVNALRRLGFTPTTAVAEDTVSSAAASLGYGYDLTDDGSMKARITLLRSQASSNMAGQRASAQGVFIEAGARAGRYRHEFGAYSAGPHLRFGDYTLASDNRGAYWRVDHSASRLSWGGGIDYEQIRPDSITLSQASKRLSLSGNFQYRLDRETSFGGNTNISQTLAEDSLATATTGSSRSINASVFYATRFYDWGRSRFIATVRRNESLVANDIAATGDEIQWEHDWIKGKYETMRPELTTTLGLAHDRSAGITQTYPTAGLVFRYWADPDWSMGGNLHYTSRSGNLSTSRGLSGSLNSERNLGMGWHMGASVHLNQVVVQTSGSSFLAPQLYRSNERSAHVYVRWDGANGIPYQSAGLRNPASAGAGSANGVVYFDANRDGEQQAGESGVPNADVFLDQRYRTTTDRDGRFVFPLVSTGHHQLSLRLESIPLPWGAAPNQGTSIEVPLRGQVTARIPVVRVGD